jgi:hypothetical protein
VCVLWGWGWWWGGCAAEKHALFNSTKERQDKLFKNPPCGPVSSTQICVLIRSPVRKAHCSFETLDILRT